jgi:hypothetical protein
MNPPIRLYMTMSLDGFIAGPDDRKGQEPGHTELELVRVPDAPGVLHLRYRVQGAR